MIDSNINIKSISDYGTTMFYAIFKISSRDDLGFIKSKNVELSIYNREYKIKKNVTNSFLKAIKDISKIRECFCNALIILKNKERKYKKWHIIKTPLRKDRNLCIELSSNIKDACKIYIANKVNNSQAIIAYERDLINLILEINKLEINIFDFYYEYYKG